MNEEGFTLIELIVVVVILGILASIGVLVYNNQQKAAIDATLQSDLRNAALSLTTESVKTGGEWGDALPDDYSGTRDNVVEFGNAQQEPAGGWNASNGGVPKQQGIFYKDWGDTLALHPASVEKGLTSSRNANGELVITATEYVNLRYGFASPVNSGVLQFSIPEELFPTGSQYARINIGVTIEADIGPTNTSMRAERMQFIPGAYTSRMTMNPGESLGDMYIQTVWGKDIGPTPYFAGSTGNPALYPGESLTVKKATLILEPAPSQNITPIYEAPPATGSSECVQAYSKAIPDRVWHYSKAEGKIKEGSCRSS